MASVAPKANILLVGAGGVGTLAAYNLELGGKAAVTAVLRSNHDHVVKNGFNIKSVNYGKVSNWKPSTILNKIPDASVQGFKPFDYIVVTTKNVADIPPTVAELIAPAVTPAHTVITLLQNGLNIEKPVMAKFPKNIVLSGVTFCGSHEHGHGDILHEYEDESYIGAFRNPNLNTEDEDKAAKEYVALYAASGKNVCEWKPDVGFTRWRKLMYNACLNPICAITDLDTGRIQLADGAADDLVKPAMNEIRAAAKACGHDLPEDLVNFMITMDPITMYNPPSMQGDVRKGNYFEYENILGEALREGKAHGVPMPTISVLYQICKAIQWRTKERRGMVKIPAQEDHTGTA